MSNLNSIPATTRAFIAQNSQGIVRLRVFQPHEQLGAAATSYVSLTVAAMLRACGVQATVTSDSMSVVIQARPQADLTALKAAATRSCAAVNAASAVGRR